MQRDFSVEGFTSGAVNSAFKLAQSLLLQAYTMLISDSSHLATTVSQLGVQEAEKINTSYPYIVIETARRSMLFI